MVARVLFSSNQATTYKVRTTWSGSNPAGEFETLN